MITLNEIGSLAIVGAAVSLLVQFIKAKAGTNEWLTLLSAVVLSLVAGLFYVFVANTVYWATFVQILTAAGAFYAYFIERFEKKA